MNKVNFYGVSLPAYATKEEFENSNTIKDLENSKNSGNSINNGGNTNYYTLPKPSRKTILNLLEDFQNGNSNILDTLEKVYALLPQTLNDLIEYKNMKPWQHECFKSLYAMNERAARSTDGSSSIQRELNKQQYYLDRGKNLNTK